MRKLCFVSVFTMRTLALTLAVFDLKSGSLFMRLTSSSKKAFVKSGGIGVGSPFGSAKGFPPTGAAHMDHEEHEGLRRRTKASWFMRSVRRAYLLGGRSGWASVALDV